MIFVVIFGEHQARQLQATVTEYGRTDSSLMDMVVTTLGVLIAMALLSCLCCLCMKLSDLRLRACVVEMAKKKGMPVDLDKVDSQHNCDSPLSKENCTIMVPDVGIIL